MSGINSNTVHEKARVFLCLFVGRATETPVSFRGWHTPPARAVMVWEQRNQAAAVGWVHHECSARSLGCAWMVGPCPRPSHCFHPLYSQHVSPRDCWPCSSSSIWKSTKTERGLSGQDSLEQFSLLQISPLKPSELFSWLKVTLKRLRWLNSFNIWLLEDTQNTLPK